MGLSTIGEGCQRSMEPKIETVVGTIVPFLQDQVCHYYYYSRHSFDPPWHMIHPFVSSIPESAMQPAMRSARCPPTSLRLSRRSATRRSAILLSHFYADQSHSIFHLLYRWLSDWSLHSSIWAVLEWPPTRALLSSTSARTALSR